MIRWLRSQFAWRPVRNSGVWLYCENAVTGQRYACWRGCGYQPLDRDWIRDGDIVDGLRGRYVAGAPSEIIYG